jgi:DMSO/TMAO reductase YedYZ molybdopterin-dependent catalytic subunit
VAVGFFDRNRKSLAKLGYSPDRLPPGQYLTERFPVLHAGDVPRYGDLSGWSLRVFGLVDREVTLSWDDLLALPQTDVTLDIHCVTKWSKLDTTWRGVRVRDLLEHVGIGGAATHLIAHAEHGYTANAPLGDVLLDEAIVAHTYEGEPLAPEHGHPARLIVPRLYFWKSAKWLRGLELVDGDRPGFWERNGYHMYGDPWREQRFEEGRP